MAPRQPILTLGVEEEYLLVDPESRDLVSRPPEAFMDHCKQALGDQVTHELLQAQVEVCTAVCDSIDEVREEIRRLRRTLSGIAREHGMRLIASSTHPSASWRQQETVDLDRYRLLSEDFQAIARRMVVCGTHVHAGIEDLDLRIDLMGQMSYFLPHLLALSTSSPFWEGQETGLKSFRTTIFGDLPRTGFPEQFEHFRDWQELLDILEECGVCDDGTKIWWDIRPSHKNPTLEMRICDMCTRLEDTVVIAALYQAILAYLYRLRAQNQTWRTYRKFLLEENKWRAQRYGVRGKLLDLGKRSLVPMAELIDELVGIIGEEAERLGSSLIIGQARTIVERGTSSENQLEVYQSAIDRGADPEEARRAIVDWLIETTLEGV